MRIACPSILSLALTCCSFNIIAQSNATIRISGLVLDSTTSAPQPLQGVHIRSEGNSYVASVSNEDGSFVLIVPKDADSLLLSHLGYRTKKIATPKSDSHLEIHLMPAPFRLSAITVKPRNPVEIVKRAIRAIPLNHPHQAFGSHCFYREIIRDSSDDLSIAEAVFRRSIFPGESEKERLQLKLIQGRASENVKATRLFEDFHPGGGPNHITGLEMALAPPSFLQEKYLDQYQYELEDLTTFNNRSVFIIRFDQKPGLKESLRKGRLYVDTETSAIIRYQSSLSPRGLPFIQHLTGSDKLMAKLLKIEFIRKRHDLSASFQSVQGRWHLQHAKQEWEVAYRQPKKGLDLQFAVQSEFAVTNFDTMVPVSIPKTERWHRNQLIINLPTSYNEDFWGSNNRIEASRGVNEVIHSINTSHPALQILQDSSSDSWSKLNAFAFKTFQDGKDLLLQPLMRTSWKDDKNGPLLFKKMLGNFKATGRVQIYSAKDSSTTPELGFQQGGIMIRTPGEDGQENYLFIGIGVAGNPKIKLIENTTIGNRSAIRAQRYDHQYVDFKIIRKNDKFMIFSKKPNAPAWSFLRSYERTNFGNEVQVGLAAFARFNGNGPKMRPDLLVRFSNIEIK